MKIGCNHELCIYNRKLECILESVEIEFGGICANCIVISLPEDLMEFYKAKLLKEYDERDN